MASFDFLLFDYLNCLTNAPDICAPVLLSMLALMGNLAGNTPPSSSGSKNQQGDGENANI